MREKLIEAEGNAAYLILYTGDRELLKVRFLTACAHFGIPFRTLRVESGVNWAVEFSRCSGVILTDSGCLKALGRIGVEQLSAALNDDIGLISYDTDFEKMDSKALEILGIETPGSQIDVSRILTMNNEHPVAMERQLNDIVTLDRPIEVIKVKSRHTILFQSDSGDPLCIVRDDKKVVTFMLPNDIWSLDVCGHCGMLDDVFYRSFVWTAKKPFITFRLPPLVSAIVDDCTGSYNHFSYVDIMNKYGWKPHLALFFAGIDEVAHENIGLDGQKIRSLYQDRQAEFGPHAIRYNELFGFDHLARCRLSASKLNENFIYHDKKINDWGIQPSRLAHMHFGEVGADCLPYLQERGYEFFTRLLPFDASWFDVPGKFPHPEPQWPYGHNSYFLSVMPENPNFFQPLAVAGNKIRETTDFPVTTDYLWDRTYFWGENNRIDIDGAVDTIVFQIRQAVTSGFYGMAATHEQRIAVMHPEQWNELWTKVDERLSVLDLKHCLLDEALYASRDLFNTAIISLIRKEDRLECILLGQARNDVELQVYSQDLPDSLVARAQPVASFENSRKINI